MLTLGRFAGEISSIPTATSWYLTDLGVALGRQELFTRQSPQKLKVLREHALIESAVSSNRIEGVEIDRSRIGTVLFGKPPFRDRNEEEVAGYREALAWIHGVAETIPVSTKTLLELHALSRGRVGDAGRFKERDGDIIEKYPDGRERVRFKTMPAGETPVAMDDLVELWRRCLEDKWIHPLIGLAAFNLDFLCIHPFRDGNGRVSRLLLLLQSYHLGFEVGRYVSIERLIEQNKDGYYEALERSSLDWHEAQNDPWPYINYLFYILKTAYKEFEERVGETASPRGAKTELIRTAVSANAGEFTVADVERACPGVSRDMIRKVFKSMQESGLIECLGRGPGATWRKKGSTPE
jgi:Fic family protein